MKNYDNFFKNVEIDIKVYGKSEQSSVNFTSNGVEPNNEFIAECEQRGYNVQFIDALQARFQEKSGWYYLITKK